MDRDRGDAELFTGPNDAEGDFSTIRNQNFLKHLVLPLPSRNRMFKKADYHTRPPQARQDALLPEQGRREEKTGGVPSGVR